MTRVAYFRVSTKDQSIEAQRVALGGTFDREFQDDGVSGATPAALRPGFSELLNFVSEGNTVLVSHVDRLGRDAIDVQTTVRKLLDKGVNVDIKGLPIIGRGFGAGDLVIAVLSQVAQMERDRILERCESGRAAARACLEATGKTHRGKASLGRPFKANAAAVLAWKSEHTASFAKTSEHFGLSIATVKRYASASKPT